MKRLLHALILFFAINIVSAQVPIDTAVNFSVKDINGNTIELFSILDEGKLAVIDFFSTSCGPCGLYAPDFQASYEDFGENQGNVFFMSICWGDDNAGVAYYDSIYGITHPSVSGSQGGGNQVHNSYQVGSTPTVILINPDREIVENYIWEPTQSNLNDAIIAHGGSMVGVVELASAQQDLFVYPNPSKGHIHVESKADIPGMYEMKVYNINGIQVYSTDPAWVSEGQFRLNADISSLPAGTYFIRLLSDGRDNGHGRLLLIE